MVRARYKWGMVIVLSAFLMIQSADTYIISAVEPQLIQEYHVTDAVLGILITSTLIVGTVLYPFWGYLYDKYSRKLLTVFMAVILGATTWINALSRVFSQLFVTRILTGIGYPLPSGAFTLTADYFEPKSRGKAMGVINAASPIGYLLGIVIPLVVIGEGLNWRYSFYITAGLSLVIGLMIYLFVKEVPRGSSEPELEGKVASDIYKVKLSDLKKILTNRSLLLLFIQGFFGTIPWTAVSFWIITYMSIVRKIPSFTITVVLLIWIIAMVAGNIISGYLSDYLFKRTPSGRAILGTIVVFLSALLIYLTLYSISDARFYILGVLTAFVLPMAGPSVNAGVMDIIEPELRGSATAYLNFFGSAGSAVGPGIVGIIATAVSLQFAMTVVSAITWIFCGIVFTLLIFIIPKDIARFHELMKARREQLNHMP
ncbi:MAG: MFS transporter [Thermoplasmatales archaeon]|nr:MFS transporter [Candidatus Thermoplasmatota archaeon]MDA8055343.1 MFS transporter [Thermoplasmatales archaeon]